MEEADRKRVVEHEEVRGRHMAQERGGRERSGRSPLEEADSPVDTERY